MLISSENLNRKAGSAGSFSGVLYARLPVFPASCEFARGFNMVVVLGARALAAGDIKAEPVGLAVDRLPGHSQRTRRRCDRAVSPSQRVLEPGAGQRRIRRRRE